LELTQELKSFLITQNELPDLIEPIVEEASGRKYYRVHFTKLNKNFVFCIENPLNKDFWVISNYLHREGFSVPKVTRINEEKGYMLLTDEGKEDLCSIKDPQERERRIYQAIGLIFRIQELDPIELVKNRSFDYEKLSWEINHTVEHYLLYKEQHGFKTMINESGLEFLDIICKKLGNYPEMVFCHRDYHSRNLLINYENQLSMIDFQDARMGNPYYDLVSLIYDPYSPMSLEKRKRYIEYFNTNSQRGKFKPLETLYFQAIQRSFKALGTYFKMVTVFQKEKYKKDILPCLENCLEICQLGMLPDSLYLYFFKLSEEIKESQD
jgi:aminoglycoside/choline kinase family phosphotransferase